MKTIDKTEDGGYLVKMTWDEHRSLERLAQAVEGKSLDDVNYRSFSDERASIDYDLGDTLEAVRAFAMAKFRTNELERLLGEFKRAVDGNNCSILEG